MIGTVASSISDEGDVSAEDAEFLRELLGPPQLPKFYQQFAHRICINCGASRLRLHSASEENNLHSETRFQRWTVREEIFLTAAVVSHFVRNHSLSPSKSDINASDSEKVVWAMIRDRIVKYNKRFFLLTGQVNPVRSLEGMHKRWKLTGSNANGKKGIGEEAKSERLLQQWNQVYNENLILSCNDDVFNSMIARFDDRTPCCDHFEDKQ